ncbi:hypothetical protein TBLA_0A10710 [Henningerozyma blattae CBS 6284]|uniref:5-formyltetrahydrofolate cyclo-ligase n=1 Tax=Henningerozyma blattae (strain ATCC 34711 / CBS 6284 / DSM 70876 / NBRC 10599 / NRRL Y-10934 / UCD 77-7) TaxID=1071380 RepID=I2GXJ7_HENB6|nr:hypothetical protein TBLA_0A10710 [Tetrapisispora blattae CBS 6284]CCH58849.1 hypothetical protein TBLA_0A10710 [Tetrapisispora blattae CBS 6284]
MSTPLSTKKALRREIAAKLCGLSKNAIHLQSQRLCARLATASWLQATDHVTESQAKMIGSTESSLHIGSYMAMPVEANLASLHMALLTSGCVLHLPRCEGRKLHWGSVKNVTELQSLTPRGRYGICEPKTAMEHVPLDIVLVPGVAFTIKGARLGHGAGYYDSWLNDYLARHGSLPLLVGVALAEQLVAQLPQEPHDVRMDYVVTGDGKLYDCKAIK